MAKKREFKLKSTVISVHIGGILCEDKKKVFKTGIGQKLDAEIIAAFDAGFLVEITKKEVKKQVKK